MKAVIQRVRHASVAVDGVTIGSIEQGMMVLLGVSAEDTEADAKRLCGKIAALRIFSDEQGHMNKSVGEVGGSVLLISQFTLLASYKKGNRPSFLNAARPEQAEPLYELCKHLLGELLKTDIAAGKFGADMQVTLCNDGPVTIVMDTKNEE